MAYQALYRKFRPDTFDGVVGQDHIVRTLKNEIVSDMVSHAYLFCGTRGTGKTSTAKIFAKAINCLNPKDGEPCGKCAMCTAIQEGRSVNVIEIDAASNNSVDNIRDIREEVKYPPTEGNYKVYIIDEVHMLSSGAFNALLKTLEEPPEFVIFILATTDPQKVPVTILSRCQRFDFKRISSGEITKTLKKYIKAEGAQAEDSALSTIGRLADGSMRDSLSILDQCLAFYHNEVITEDKVLEVCGATDDGVFFDITDAIISKNPQKAMDIIDETVFKGRDIAQFTASLMQHLRNLLIALTVNEAEGIIDLSQEKIKQLSLQAKKTSPEEVIYFIRIFSQLLSDMKYAANQRILLEVEIIKLCSNVPKNNIDYISARLSELERKIKSGAFAVSAESKKSVEKEKPKPKAMPKAIPDDIKSVNENWDNILMEMDSIDRSIFAKAMAGYMDDGRLTIICDDGYKKIVESKKNILSDKLSELFKKEFDIKTVDKSEYENYQKMTYGDNYTDDDGFGADVLGKFSDAEIEIID